MPLMTRDCHEELTRVVDGGAGFLDPVRWVVASFRAWPGCQHLRREAVRLRPLAGLAAQLLPARLCGRDAGADALLRQLALELSDAGQHGRHHPPVRRREVAWAASWHLREETYRRALAILVNAQQAQPLAAHFGAADVSSSDGQHFPTGGPGEAVGAVNSHYGRDATTLLYTHVSARHAPFHTVAIPPSGEAAHVIDGLLYHEADLASAVHHTDGGGVSDHVFALSHVLGFRFAPRIPNLAERRLYAFGAAATWPALQRFIAGTIDTKLIAAHWDEVLRLAASVRTGRVSASLMLKRLGA
jgi:TnpA family transposase